MTPGARGAARILRVAVAIVAAVTVSVGMSGCLPALRSGQRAVAPADMATPPPAPLLAGSPDVIVPAGTLVATGEVRSTEYEVLGRVAIHSTGDGSYDITFDGYRPDDGVEVLGSTQLVDPTTECDTDTASQIDLGSLAPRSTRPLPMSANANRFAKNDPSFLFSLVMIRLDGLAACPVTIQATSTLEWHLPKMNPRVHPFDFGARVDADGIARPQQGLPFQYTVAAGDTWTAVAARFGITPTDLQWLNPTLRMRDGLRIGQTLNVDPDSR